MTSPEKLKEEFNLSEKINDDNSNFGDMLSVKNVKEFIRLLKDNNWDLTGKSSDYIDGYNEAFRIVIKKIDKLAGEKLC
jgi:hypothetical protein